MPLEVGLRRLYHACALISFIALLAVLLFALLAIAPRWHNETFTWNDCHFRLSPASDGFPVYISASSHNALNQSSVEGLISANPSSASGGLPLLRYWHSRPFSYSAPWLIELSLWIPVLLTSVLPGILVANKIRSSERPLTLRLALGLLIAINLLLGCWAITNYLGANSIVASLDRQLVAHGSKRLETDPLADDRDYFPQHHWHYIEDARSPFPFIVGYYVSTGTRDDGKPRISGQRKHSLWLFGLTYPLSYWDGNIKTIIW